MNNRTKTLLRENNTLEKQLSQNSDRILTDIVVYIRGANISDYQQEVIRRDIIQMILDGERRGDSIETVIGEDYRVFCDSVLREIPQLRLKYKILACIGTVCLSLALLCAIRLVFGLPDLISGEYRWPYIPVTAGELISMVLITCSASALVRVLTKNAFNGDIRNLRFLLIAILLVCMGANVFLKTILFSVHVAAISMGILVLFLIYKAIDLKI